MREQRGQPRRRQRRADHLFVAVGEHGELQPLRVQRGQSCGRLRVRRQPLVDSQQVFARGRRQRDLLERAGVVERVAGDLARNRRSARSACATANSRSVCRASAKPAPGLCRETMPPAAPRRRRRRTRCRRRRTRFRRWGSCVASRSGCRSDPRRRARATHRLADLAQLVLERAALAPDHADGARRPRRGDSASRRPARNAPRQPPPSPGSA